VIKWIACSIIIIMSMVVSCSTKRGSIETTKDLPDFDALWDYNDPAATEVRFRELLPAVKAGNDLSSLMQLMTQIARAQGLQRKFDEAHAMLDSVQGMIKEELVVANVRYLLERGRVINFSGDPKKAKPYFLDAYEIASANNEDYYAIDAIHMLQIVDPPEEQLKWAGIALEMAEKTTDERARKWLGPLYNNTGWTYFDLKQYDKALELFEKSLAYCKSINDEEGIFIAHWTIARTYREVSRIDEALALQQALKQEIDEKGLEPDGYVYEEIGECLLILQRMDEAVPYFAKAYELLSQDPWLQANEQVRLDRLKSLGGVE
jgi:tetratricopeptide (TPR) repeat protein